jgi:hypothetical protein
MVATERPTGRFDIAYGHRSRIKESNRVDKSILSIGQPSQEIFIRLPDQESDYRRIMLAAQLHAAPLVQVSGPNQAGLSSSLSNVPGLTQERIRCGDLRQAAFWAFGDMLNLLRIARWKSNYDSTSKFSRNEELPYCKYSLT